MYCVLRGMRLHQLMQIIRRECPESMFVMCFTQFEAPPADTHHLQGVSRIDVCIVFHTVQAPPADTNHFRNLQGVSGISVCIVFYTA